MRQPQDHQALNRVLASHQLGTLDQQGVVQQLAFLVVDHEHFRELLAVCEPHLRRDMYEAMSGYLRFPARPLDVYMAETARLAVAKELPLQNADGTLSAFKPAPDVLSGRLGETIPVQVPKAFSPYSAPPFKGQTIDVVPVPIDVVPSIAEMFHENDDFGCKKIAQRAVDFAFGEVLTLTCRKCTRQEQFTGNTKPGAIMNARRAGWTYDELLGNCSEICPECPAVGSRLN